ncbi:hypothetical protein F4819DRAFT_492711 [Hypoxylon fuscum]|nr:hypothetical protein F4819DRAFT_492711 [Hypoxylon fuscum]
MARSGIDDAFETVEWEKVSDLDDDAREQYVHAQAGTIDLVAEIAGYRFSTRWGALGCLKGALPTFQAFPDDDGRDDTTPRLTARKFMVLFAMSILWIASRIALYLHGAAIPILVADLGGTARYA